MKHPPQPIMISFLSSLRLSLLGAWSALLLIMGSGCGSDATEHISNALESQSTYSILNQDEDPRVALRDWAFVRLPLQMLSPGFIQETGFNRDEKQDDMYAFGYMARTKLNRLSPQKREAILELNESLLMHHEFDAKTLKLLDRMDAEAIHALNPMRQDAGFEDYHNYDQLTAELQKLAAEFPEISNLRSIGTSEENRELWVMKISDNAVQDESEPRLLYIANLHGNEVVGRELMIYLIRQVLSGYGTDSRVTRLVDHSEIFIMPSANPDGYERKQRYNAKHIDLNRTFPDFTADPNDTPEGRAKEIQAIMALHDKYHFLLAFNFHGGAVGMNLPWDTKRNSPESEKFGDDPIMWPFSREYADLNPEMVAHHGASFDHGVSYGYEWYTIDGGLQDWACYYRQSIHATVELSGPKWPTASTLPTYWQHNQDGLFRYLEHGLEGIHLQVIDEEGAGIRDVSIEVSGLRTLRYPDGIVHRVTLAGEQIVTVTAKGYEPQTVALTTRIFDGIFDQLVMKPVVQPPPPE